MAKDHSEPKLQRVIGLSGAVMLGLGSIIGTGVFVSLSIGVSIAGPMVMPAIALAISTHPERWQTALNTERLPNLLPAAALMFVAFTGYGRIATLSEEVAEPRNTIPRAVIATLAVTMLLYLVVAWVGLANAENQFGSLAKVAESFAGSTLGKVMTVGAAIAMMSVLLNLVAWTLARDARNGTSGGFTEGHCAHHRVHQSARGGNDRRGYPDHGIGLRGRYETHLELQRFHGARVLRTHQPVRNSIET